MDLLNLRTMLEEPGGRTLDRLLTDEALYTAMSRASSPFGDVGAAERIVRRLRREVTRNARPEGEIHEERKSGIVLPSFPFLRFNS